MTANFGEQLPELTLAQATPALDTDQVHRLPGAVLRIPVSVQVVIGTARLKLSEVAELSPGAVITLDEKLGMPSRVLVNGREVAKGDLFVLDGEDGRLGLTISEVTGNNQAAP